MYGSSSLLFHSDDSLIWGGKRKFDVSRVSFLLNTSEFNLKRTLIRNTYSTFSIPKKRGGLRKISVPCPRLARIQKIFADQLLIDYRSWMEDKKEDTFFQLASFSLNERGGYSPIMSNANPHIGKPYLLKLDIKDFYASIKGNHLIPLFKNHLNVNDEVAYLLTLLCTKNNNLPTGAPTSSVVAELFMHEFDRRVLARIDQFKCTYTRYADDISISSETKMHHKAVANFIQGELDAFDLKLNQEKTLFLGPNQAKYVTGIKVNEKFNIDRKYIRNLRAILHNWEREGCHAASIRYFSKNQNLRLRLNQSTKQTFKNSLKGKIDWVGQVRGWKDEVYLKLRIKFNELNTMKHD